MVTLGGHLRHFFLGSIGPRRSATCVNCALEALLRTYLLTYWLTYLLRLQASACIALGLPDDLLRTLNFRFVTLIAHNSLLTQLFHYLKQQLTTQPQITEAAFPHQRERRKCPRLTLMSHLRSTLPHHALVFVKHREQESRRKGTARCSAIVFGLKFADDIHYKFRSSQASKARLQSSNHTGAKQNSTHNGHSRSRVLELVERR